jgi:predicted RNA-binding protein YlqC (UPF0109 family)
MEELIKHIIVSIADHQEDVQIHADESEFGFIQIDIEVHPEDMGKVIGKQGKIISAIRKLAKAKAVKLGRRVQINLIDPQGSEFAKMRPQDEEEQDLEEERIEEDIPTPEEDK